MVTQLGGEGCHETHVPWHRWHQDQGWYVTLVTWELKSRPVFIFCVMSPYLISLTCVWCCGCCVPGCHIGVVNEKMGDKSEDTGPAPAQHWWDARPEQSRDLQWARARPRPSLLLSALAFLNIYPSQGKTKMVTGLVSGMEMTLPRRWGADSPILVK